MLPAVRCSCREVASLLETFLCPVHKFPYRCVGRRVQEEISMAAVVSSSAPDATVCRWIGISVHWQSVCYTATTVLTSCPRRIGQLIASYRNTRHINTAMSFATKFLELDSLFSSQVSVYRFPRIFRLMAATFGGQLCVLLKQGHLQHADRECLKADIDLQ